MMGYMKNTSITLYGIPNCDTVKKARAWLVEHGVTATFVDFKKQGAPAELLPIWAAAVGWERLLNRKGTSWRKLEESVRAAVLDERSAIALMLAQPSVIKRPVVAWHDGDITVGFDALGWLERVS